MENPGARMLPEADALPDGFSSSEVLAPTTPSHETEKTPYSYHESTVLKQECSSNSGHELAVHEPMLNGRKAEKEKKLRTFPVPLFEKDGYDASGESADVSDDGSLEQREHGFVKHKSGSPTAETSVVSSLGDEKKKKDQSESKRTCSGGPDVPEDHAKEASSSSEYLKNKKEVPEAKRKSSKRTFKTEKEFLEFTLQYQKVLAERDAAISVRDKLESLCRELQRQNRLLMDECKKVSEEGQTLRLDLSNKFDNAIKDVSHKLEEHKGDYISQLKENEMLRGKLKQLADQYTLSEQQHSQQLTQKSLELQIADLKIQQHVEKSAQEQAQMKVYSEQVSQLLATEKNLRLQLNADGEKFQQFQDALQKSNEVFETFKLEIEKMSKSIKELRKENTFLKSKSEKSDVTLIELVEERELLKKQLEKTKNQKEKLESLCRSLQADRKQQASNLTSSSTETATAES